MRVTRAAPLGHMPNPIDTFPDPVVGVPWGELGAIRRAARLLGRWHVDAVLGYPVEGLLEPYTEALSERLGAAVTLDLTFAPPPGEGVAGASHIVAVASGKGGVGKSTTAVNLALGLDRAGAKAGILDADIYGPSQGMMLGVPEGRRPEVRDQRTFIPMRVHGIEAISMSMMVTDRTPMVWRGPMASGALQQLIGQTEWGGLDYLVVDMPPGTGDIQLTLSQQARVSGAVIVTTPQDIALLDARKGIEMFRKVDIPILGIVENMSWFECDGCGKAHHLFAAGGGQRVAEEYGVELLGEFPLDPRIRESTDGGKPTVAADPTGSAATLYVDCARRIAGQLWRLAQGAAPPPTISMDDQ